MKNPLGCWPKRWLPKPTPDTTQVQALSRALGVSPVLATLLVQRSITDFDQAKAYFRPSMNDLHDPFVMHGMDLAVRRLHQAIAQQKPILVYGDYDVDGVTAVAMCYDFLQRLGANVHFYIPDRYAEGYGISMQAVTWAATHNIDLMVSLDCGIKAIDCIAQAKGLGIDVIVCDHHEPGDTLPAAYAILDPKQPHCPYPTKALSGCGVGFKLLQGYVQQQGLSTALLRPYLDLVAVSIACDIVPIVGENRILAYHGLQQINTTPRPGLEALMTLGHMNRPLSIRDLVFGLGPRINAAGRIDHARGAVALLLATDREAAEELAQAIDSKNSTRRELDSTITEEALKMIADHPQHTRAKTTVLFKEDWHKGVIGIVASRCIERYYRPTIILTKAADGKATGSARSVAGYNVYQAIEACADLLEQYGGHAHAAGLTLSVDNVPAFKQRFEEVVAQSISTEALTPPQPVDLPLQLRDINDKFYNVLRQMAPFGTGNMHAVFVTEQVIAKSYRIIKDRHLKLYVSQPGFVGTLEAIGFDLAHYEPLVQGQKKFKMAYTIEESHYLGERCLQLNIKDIQGMTPTQ